MKKKEGFTLVELLIVVAIITIITAIAVPNIMSARIRAKVSGAKSEMGSIAILLEDYKMDHSGSYPSQYTSPDTITNDSNPPSPTNVVGLGKLIYPTTSNSTPIYLSTIPKDPFNTNDKPGGYYSYFTSGDECWALVSWGPDKNNDVSNYADAKAAVENGTNMYDQSKGLTTTGDIVIIGP